MYNLTNNSAGPLGQAGQANNSTMPAGIFTNAGPQFNNFGQGVKSFLGGLEGKRKALMEKLFPGADGSFGGVPEALGQIPGNLAGIPGNVAQGVGQAVNGAQSIFGTPQAGQQQTSPLVGPAPTGNTPAPQPGASNGFAPKGAFGAPGGGAPGAGFLSRFMGGAQ